MAKKPTQKDLEELRRSLMAARAALAGDIQQLEGAHHQEFNLELLERDEALERLDEGVYGQCESCAVWIPKTRLKAVPHARHCVECQRGVENR